MTGSPDFRRNEVLHVTIDAIASRYGRLPSEVMSLDLDDFTINKIVCRTAVEYEVSVRKGKPKTLKTGRESNQDLKRKLDAMLAQVSGKRRKPGRL